jgi:UDP-N-acetyl-D-mannosaminuronic acid dehydrogenase
MPAYAIDLLAGELGALDGRAIGILGVAYRGGVKEHAFSGAATLRDELLARGATPLASDPLYGDAELAAAGYEPWRAGTAVDGAIVQADHEQYRTLGPADVGGARVVVDGRGVLDVAAFAAAGVHVLRIGRP